MPQRDLFGNWHQEKPEAKPQRRTQNPMLATFGSRAPFTCRFCDHFRMQESRCSRSDDQYHDPAWEACGLYRYTP